MHLLEHTPCFEIDTAVSLADRLYGIHGSGKLLSGERDQNFLIVTGSEKFILKIANGLDDRALLEAQNAVLAHLATRLSFCPSLVPTLAGEQIAQIGDAERNNLVRVVRYLPGVPLGQIRPHSPSLLRDLGRKLGHLDRALVDFDHPAVHRDFHWDLANGLRVIRKYGQSIRDHTMRALVYECAQRFEGDVVTLLPALRRTVIHGDANDYNVLVSDSQPQSVTGLIDFGDIVHSYTVGELAVALAYVVLDKADPIGEAVHVVAGYNEEYSLSEAEFEALNGLTLMRLCMSVCLAAHQHQQCPENSYLEISQRSIRNSFPKLAALDARVVADTFRSACGIAPKMKRDLHAENFSKDKMPTKADTIATREKLLGRNLSLAYQNPVKIVRGWMQYLYDDEDHEYLDAYNNVAHVGHCHARVVKAGHDQMAVLNTNTRYLHDLINRYAERLTAIMPSPLRVCFFVNSGSEANELALRLARAHTGARDLIVLDHAYHGNTTTLIDISPYKHDGPGGEGTPAWVHKVPLPDVYRGLYRSDDVHAGDKYARHVSETIDQLRERGVALSGFIAESLPSVGGQLVLPPDYLSHVYTAVRQAGGVCIADEVQTGYGRIGTHFWGFDSYGVVPDVVVLGKPIGNGHPIGAVITTPEIAASFANGMEFFSTFGGNTVSCAIGLAVLDVVLEENLQVHALRVGERMREGLNDLMSRHEIIGDVRGSGMFLGVELVRSRVTREPAVKEAQIVVNRLRADRILLGTDGPFHNVLKIRPPMPFCEANADRVIEALDHILAVIP
jgi:4-aminobutyrate aminotransferase-like enzyme